MIEPMGIEPLVFGKNNVDNSSQIIDPMVFTKYQWFQYWKPPPIVMVYNNQKPSGFDPPNGWNLKNTPQFGKGETSRNHQFLGFQLLVFGAVIFKVYPP